MWDDRTWGETQIVLFLSLLGILLLTLAVLKLYEKFHDHNRWKRTNKWERKWSKKKRKWSILALFLSVSLLSICFCSEPSYIIKDYEFTHNVNEYLEALESVDFNFTCSSGNATLTINYVNKLDGLKTSDCYVNQYTIFVDGAMVTSKVFTNNVQEFDIEVPLSVHSNLGEQHYGELRLLGTAEKGKPFYGTVDIGLEVESSASSFPDAFEIFMGTCWILAFIAVGVTISLLIRRRHRGKAQEE